MIVTEKNNLKFLQFNNFPSDKLTHGIFTRAGGVSDQSYSSLNVGGTTGDSRINVVENRNRIFEVFDKPYSSIYDVWQVHSEKVVYANAPRKEGESHLKADAIITDAKNVSLFMQFADCVPILFYDSQKNVCGIAHAGWQGTVKRIVQKTIRFMITKFGSDPKHILAGIGPSIGPDHYEIGNDVVKQVEEKLEEFSNQIVFHRNQKLYLDLWSANKLLLLQCGVTQIETADICTACNLGDWYSYRMEGQRSGRFGVLLGLK
ncbi:MAG TPA: peptidoglycan editing factor PgeF [Anaerolineaceae bacterium]|nr:peptidoglycan editing factor PgeF [Anaerolineaceae bacterium]